MFIGRERELGTLDKLAGRQFFSKYFHRLPAIPCLLFHHFSAILADKGEKTCVFFSFFSVFITTP